MQPKTTNCTLIACLQVPNPLNISSGRSPSNLARLTSFDALVLDFAARGGCVRMNANLVRVYKYTIEQMILTGTTHGIVFNGTTVVDLDSR